MMSRRQTVLIHAVGNSKKSRWRQAEAFRKKRPHPSEESEAMPKIAMEMLSPDVFCSSFAFVRHLPRDPDLILRAPAAA